MKSKINNFVTGILIGALVPPLTLYLIYEFWTKTNTFSEFLKNLTRNEIQTNVYIITLIPVFAIFSFLYFKKYDHALKGIVLPTMVYTIALVLLNF